jgi:hypothetical protein
MFSKKSPAFICLTIALFLVALGSQASAQSDCSSNPNASVGDSTACGIGMLYNSLHRNEKYQVDAASAEAVDKFLSHYMRRVDEDSRVFFADEEQNGSRIGFGQYGGELAFVMPVFHRHYSYLSGAQYKCRGILYVTPTKIAFESASNADGFSFMRSELTESQYQVERGDDGRNIIKVKAGSQTYILAPDCYRNSAHQACYYPRPFVLFDAAVQNFDVLAYAFAQHVQTLQ